MDMKTTHDAVLDSLLCEWHQWASRGRTTRGYTGCSAGFSGYRVSRQYDDANGALDDAMDDGRMRQVEFEVGELASLHQAALRCQARALTIGVTVFASPRLPADPNERQAVVRQARAALTKRLLASGVI